ncbi:uncharacterized protein LOC135943735, partial [Cloeon dipterum]|uniref:uncharacterized protein LOC135943735 n=1 Tax=Cloeon dipterum TaxID=197152 RepID=UPI00321FAB70
FVLVVHYDFKNTDRFRKCDKPDLDNLRTTFRENRNCNMRELSSPNKMILLKLLSDQEMLLRFFRSKDVPDLFVLFVLSHGNENGTIFTDHKESNEFVSFTTDDVFASLKKLTAFEKCLKLINFGPCRGTLTDEIVVNGSGDTSRIITSLPGFYSWKSEQGKDIRGRRAFVLFEEQQKEVLEMENALHQNLDFETSEWRLSESNLSLYFEKVSKLEHDVGCILTCIFGQICENEEKEVCILVDKKEKPVTDILHRFVGPKNRKWIGKPKIFFLVRQKAREIGTDSLLTCSDAHISASNHSGWLVLILNDEGTLMQLIKILQGQELKQDKKSSLQELLAPLLISNTKEINILLNSTLHCCLNFPDWPRTFIEPELKIKRGGNSPFQKIGFDELIDEVVFSSKESQMDDSSGANNRETEDSALAWLLSSVAGAGKTTVFKEIAYQLAKFDLGIKVLHVSLKKHSIYMLNMSEVEINITKFLAETTWTDPDDMKNWVEERKVIVFFDGFSEILSSQRDKVLKIARTLKEMRIPFIFGARPHETEGILEILESAAIVEIQHLDEEKQRMLLRSVAGKKDDIIEKLVSNIELKDIMGNPLYLLLLAESNGEGGLYEIFDRVVRKNMKICMERDNDGKEVTDENVEINLDHLRLIAHHSLSGSDVLADETLENMSAWHESLEVDPDGDFLDGKEKNEEDFKLLLADVEYCDCVVLATAPSVGQLQKFVETCGIKVPDYKNKRIMASSVSTKYSLGNPNLRLNEELVDQSERVGQNPHLTKQIRTHSIGEKSGDNLTFPQDLKENTSMEAATSANTDSSRGSWFVRNLCNCLNWTEEKPLLPFLTTVQFAMHQESLTAMNLLTKDPLGQTLEIKLFSQSQSFIISRGFSRCLKEDLEESTKISESVNYSWKSDHGQNIRGRSAFILFEQKKEEVEEMKNALQQNLDFDINDWRLTQTNLNLYYQKVSKLEHDVGCILTCIFGQIREDKTKGVSVIVDKNEKPISEILHQFVGAKNDSSRWVGKPKILFLVNQEALECDSVRLVADKNTLKQLIGVLNDKELKEEKKSLQELLMPLLISQAKKEKTLLNSTLQYLVSFPNWPLSFISPGLLFKKFENSPSKKIGFDELMGEAEISFIDNIRTDSDQNESATANHIWILSAVAGAGKTTVLKEIAHRLSKHERGVKTLLIPLKKYSMEMYNMSALHFDEIEFLSKTAYYSIADINDLIESKQIIVFLDGFDEICQNHRDKAMKLVKGLKKKGVPFCVGTRPHEVDAIMKILNNEAVFVEIELLTKAKQLEFLQSVSGKNEDESIEFLNSHEEKDILKNPLHLSLLVEYNRKGNLYELYESVVQQKVKICLERNNDFKPVAEEKIILALHLLRLIAFRFSSGIDLVGPGVTNEDLKKMNDLGVATVLDGNVTFVHRTFAEFLTAQKFIHDLHVREKTDVPLFKEGFEQCRQFVDLFYSTAEAMKSDEKNTKTLSTLTNSIDPYNLMKHTCEENLRKIFKMIKPHVSLKNRRGMNGLHHALRHLEMVKLVHERDSSLATDVTKDGDTSLHLAIKDWRCSEDVAIWLIQQTGVDVNAENKNTSVQLLLDRNAKVNAKGNEGYTSIHLADVDSKEEYGWTALHIAVKRNRPKMAQILLEYGADINLKSNKGWSALHEAVIANRPDILQQFLDHGADVNLEGNGYTALHLAVQGDNQQLVRMLINHGADVNKISENGLAALHIAAKNKNAEMIQSLLDHNAEVNLQTNEKWTALILAVYHNHEESVQKLLENGADSNYPHLVQKLLEHGALVNPKTNSGRTALYITAQGNFPESMQILLDHGADVNVQDKYGNTALNIAVLKNNSDCVQKLLEHGADVNSPSNDGWNALHIAVNYNHQELVQILLNQGADINAQSKDGTTALQVAVTSNYPDLVEKLLKHGVEVNLQANNGLTALHLAVDQNNSCLTQMLLDHGIDANLKDESGRTALYVAVYKNYPELVQELLIHGADLNLQGWFQETVSTDTEGQICLMDTVVSKNYREILKILLNQDVDGNIKQWKFFSNTVLK